MENKFPTEYDKEIRENLPHLNNYPELLPFIGANYKQMATKIFLIGESHYIDEDVKNKLKAISGDDRFLTDWYNQNSSKFDDETSGWLRTRGNIFNIEENKTTDRTISSFYGNLRKELKENVDLIDKENIFSNFIFYNYFQRPAFKDGDSIGNYHNDDEKAYETLLYMAKTFKPDKIIFVTVKGCNAYNKVKFRNPSQISDKIIVDFVPHASCKWWNTKSQKYGNKENPKMKGKEKFIFLLKCK